MNSSIDPNIISDRISFREKQKKSVFARLSPRVFIYPIVILGLCWFMSKNKQLQKHAEMKQNDKQTTVVRFLDPSKPAALVSAEPVVVFPQLIFYHEDNLKNISMVENLNEKYHKKCTVAAVNLNTSPELKGKYGQITTPFAVFTRPDGMVVTIEDISTEDFFDKLLSSSLVEVKPVISE